MHADKVREIISAATDAYELTDKPHGVFEASPAGVSAFRAWNAASAVTHVIYLITDSEDAEDFTDICSGVFDFAWKAAMCDPDERTWQAEQLRVREDA